MPKFKMPLWKEVVGIFVIIAMPLFFSFIRTAQLQNAINKTQNQNTQ